MKVNLRSSKTVGILFLLFLPTILPAQQSSVIREPAFGVEFTAPDGWQYQKTEGGYVMGHNSIAGLIVVTINPYKTLAEMRQGAYEGIQEEGGTSLNLSGELKAFGTNGLAGDYQGTMNWEQVKAYIIGLISPVGGKGVTCMILTTPSMYSETHKTTLKTLAKSLKFFKPETPDVVKEWDATFKTPGGCRLKYMSVSSSSYSGYSSSSSETTFDLCPNGQFSYSSNSEFSMSIDAGSAANSSNDDGAGRWELSFNGENAVLMLHFNDGREWEYVLSYINQKTYLDDTRYYLLLHDEGPGCY